MPLNTPLNQDIQVQLEIGHRSTPKHKKTPDGHTHDWTVFVRGFDDCNINSFVEKVVFYLHESFPKPKRVIKEPPYQIEESGYASFEIPIEVYFRNKEEPKKISFDYDMVLDLTRPAAKTRIEKLTFQHPSADFKKKLLKGGGSVFHAEEPNRSLTAVSKAKKLEQNEMSTNASDDNQQIGQPKSLSPRTTAQQCGNHYSARCNREVTATIRTNDESGQVNRCPLPGTIQHQLKGQVDNLIHLQPRILQLKGEKNEEIAALNNEQEDNSASIDDNRTKYKIPKLARKNSWPNNSNQQEITDEGEYLELTLKPDLKSTSRLFSLSEIDEDDEAIGTRDKLNPSDNNMSSPSHKIKRDSNNNDPGSSSSGTTPNPTSSPNANSKSCSSSTTNTTTSSSSSNGGPSTTSSASSSSSKHANSATSLSSSTTSSASSSANTTTTTNNSILKSDKSASVADYPSTGSSSTSRREKSSSSASTSSVSESKSRPSSSLLQNCTSTVCSTSNSNSPTTVATNSGSSISASNSGPGITKNLHHQSQLATTLVSTTHIPDSQFTDLFGPPIQTRPSSASSESAANSSHNGGGSSASSKSKNDNNQPKFAKCATNSKSTSIKSSSTSILGASTTAATSTSSNHEQLSKSSANKSASNLANLASGTANCSGSIHGNSSASNSSNSSATSITAGFNAASARSTKGSDKSFATTGTKHSKNPFSNQGASAAGSKSCFGSSATSTKQSKECRESSKERHSFASSSSFSNAKKESAKSKRTDVLLSQPVPNSADEPPTYDAPSNKSSFSQEKKKSSKWSKNDFSASGDESIKKKKKKDSKDRQRSDSKLSHSSKNSAEDNVITTKHKSSKNKLNSDKLNKKDKKRKQRNNNSSSDDDCDNDMLSDNNSNMSDLNQHNSKPITKRRRHNSSSSTGSSATASVNTSGQSLLLKHTPTDGDYHRQLYSNQQQAAASKNGHLVADHSPGKPMYPSNKESSPFSDTSTNTSGHQKKQAFSSKQKHLADSVGGHFPALLSNPKLVKSSPSALFGSNLPYSTPPLGSSPHSISVSPSQKLISKSHLHHDDNNSNGSIGGLISRKESNSSSKKHSKISKDVVNNSSGTATSHLMSTKIKYRDDNSVTTIEIKSINKEKTWDNSNEIKKLKTTKEKSSSSSKLITSGPMSKQNSSAMKNKSAMFSGGSSENLAANSPANDFNAQEPSKKSKKSSKKKHVPEAAMPDLPSAKSKKKKQQHRDHSSSPHRRDSKMPPPAVSPLPTSLSHSKHLTTDTTSSYSPGSVSELKAQKMKLDHHRSPSPAQPSELSHNLKQQKALQDYQRKQQQPSPLSQKHHTQHNRHRSNSANRNHRHHYPPHTDSKLDESDCDNRNNEDDDEDEFDDDDKMSTVSDSSSASASSASLSVSSFSSASSVSSVDLSTREKLTTKKKKQKKKSSTQKISTKKEYSKMIDRQKKSSVKTSTTNGKKQHSASKNAKNADNFSKSKRQSKSDSMPDSTHQSSKVFKSSSKKRPMSSDDDRDSMESESNDSCSDSDIEHNKHTDGRPIIPVITEPPSDSDSEDEMNKRVPNKLLETSSDSDSDSDLEIDNLRHRAKNVVQSADKPKKFSRKDELLAKPEKSSFPKVEVNTEKKSRKNRLPASSSQSLLAPVNNYQHSHSLKSNSSACSSPVKSRKYSPNNNANGNNTSGSSFKSALRTSDYGLSDSDSSQDEDDDNKDHIDQLVSQQKYKNDKISKQPVPETNNSLQPSPPAKSKSDHHHKQNHRHARNDSESSNDSNSSSSESSSSSDNSDSEHENDNDHKQSSANKSNGSRGARPVSVSPQHTPNSRSSNSCYKFSSTSRHHHQQSQQQSQSHSSMCQTSTQVSSLSPLSFQERHQRFQSSSNSSSISSSNIYHQHHSEQHHYHQQQQRHSSLSPMMHSTNSSSASSPASGMPGASCSPYELREIQQKIASVSDSELLQRVVDLIEERNKRCFRIVDNCLQFDLLKLDQMTLNEIKRMLVC